MQIHPMPEKRLCLNYAKMYGIRTREKPAVSLLQIQMLRDHTFLNCVDLCGTGINRGGIYNINGEKYYEKNKERHFAGRFHGFSSNHHVQLPKSK